MEQTTIESTTRLQIVRRYSASREAVFEALTEPSLLARWFAPSDQMEAHVDRFEARVGGAYRIEMRHVSGAVHTAVGTVREIEPPQKLVYTWKWEGGVMPDTLVTWTLKEVDDGTELTLVHERFPNEEARQQHEQGWTSIFEKLETLFARGAARLLEIGLDVNGRLFRNALDGVSDDDFSTRLNERTNSMQWIAGHLARTRVKMAQLVDADVKDQGMGVFDAPIDPATDYPDKEAIVKAWNEATKALLERLPHVSEADLSRPAPMKFPVSEQTIGGGIAFLVEHEGYHVGQLGFVRKALGYEAVLYL